MNILDKLKVYINNNLEDNVIMQKSFIGRGKMSYDAIAYEESSLNNYINNNKDEYIFRDLLFKYIDDRDLKDSDVYNKVNIDRRLFSKIRNENYHPSKDTVILLGLALELNEDEMDELLKSASYSLPKNNIFDLIIRFCFKEKIYKLIEVNELLDSYKCKTFI